MRILITGSAGTVGSYAPTVLARHDLHLADRATLDITKNKLRADNYDAVIHLAAATDVDACEQDPDLAYRTNAVGTMYVAQACELAGVPLVYVSTAGVFGGDGAPGPFTEFDAPCPANVYGRSKLAGEVLAREQTRRLYVVRAGWMFGGDRDRDPKFVGKIVRKITQGSGPIFAVNDKIGSPTYAHDLLVYIEGMLDHKWSYGTYHAANAGTASRYEVATAIADAYHCSAVKPAPSEMFPLPAPRADSEAMRSYKAELMGLPRMRPWQDALAEHLGSVRAAAA